jgi:SAM-dependent methyltransferase
MPSPHSPRQADSQTPRWLQHEAGRAMLWDVQRMAIPELTRKFGQHGLYLHPSAGLPIDLSGNALANVISLHRDRAVLTGQFRCIDSELPISTASLSLVYSLFMLESSPTPEALLREIARVLQPEGTVLLISLNPWSQVRSRWFLGARRVIGPSAVGRMARDVGLDVIRRQAIGRHLLRTASLVVLRRREAGLTPLRKPSPAVSLRPGMSAG